ncbi:response regulator [Desulfococcaceae bacterium HSG8]|nr:response regulator [Desulfococcaceae bacterium HSG8]
MERIRNARILVVEDNFINQEVAIEILDSAGIIADIANHGKEAVEAFCKSSYDAILMDIQMPEMDGFEATKAIRDFEIRNSKSEIPIIAMTAHAMKGDREKCFKAGMNDYITKPIDIDELFSTLNRWIKPETGNHKPEIRKSEPDEQQITLPDNMPGIDIKSGLKRVVGNKRLFVKILTEFSENYRNSASDIRDALEKGNQNLALQLLHTLKGMAGNISAKGLYRASLEFEENIKTGSISDMNDMADSLERSLNRVMESVKQLEENVEQSECTESLESECEIAPCIIELAGFLLKNNPRAETCLASIKTNLGNLGFQKEMKLMEDQISRFDFRNARETLSEISEALGIPMEIRNHSRGDSGNP